MSCCQRPRSPPESAKDSARAPDLGTCSAPSNARSFLRIRLTPAGGVCLRVRILVRAMAGAATHDTRCARVCLRRSRRSERRNASLHGLGRLIRRACATRNPRSAHAPPNSNVRISSCVLLEMASAPSRRACVRSTAPKRCSISWLLRGGAALNLRGHSSFLPRGVSRFPSSRETPGALVVADAEDTSRENVIFSVSGRVLARTGK